MVCPGLLWVGLDWFGIPGLVEGEVCEPAGDDGCADCVLPPDGGGVCVAEAALYAQENAVSNKSVVKQSRFMKYLE